MKRANSAVLRMTILIALLGFLPLLTGQQMMNDPLLDLKVDVVYLSSDLLEGRETGKEGEVMAAQYIARRFQELGLEPKGSGGSWYQSFDFNFKAHPHAEKGEPRTGRNVL